MAEGFVVERIVDDKFVVGPGGKTERVFLVKWEGYPYGENTWEPRESFIPEAMETIQEYEKSHPLINHTAKSQMPCDENESESSYDPCDNLCDNPFDNTFDNAPKSLYLRKKKKTPKRRNNSNHSRLQMTPKKTKKKKKSIRKSENKPLKRKIPTKNIKKIKKKNKKKRKFESHSESDDEPICNKFNNKQTFNNSKSVKRQLQNTAKAAPARVPSSVSSMRIPKRKNGEYHSNMSFQERVKLSLQPKTKIVGFNTAKPPQKRNNSIYSNCNAKQTPARKKRKIEKPPKPDSCFYSDSDQSDVPSISPMPNIPDSYQESVQKVESLKNKIQTNIQTNATQQTKIASNTPNTTPSDDSDLISNNHNNHNNRNNIPNTNADSTQGQTIHTMTNHNVFPNKTNEAMARHTLTIHNSNQYQSNFHNNAFNANPHKQSFLSYSTWNNAKPTSLNNNNPQWHNATMSANANTNDTDNKCISISGIPAVMNQHILCSELQRTQLVNIRYCDQLYVDPNHRYPHFKLCQKMELSNMDDKNKLIRLCQMGQLRVNGQLISVTSYHKPSPLPLPCTNKPQINHIQYTNMSGPHDRNINTNHNHIHHPKITNKKVHDLTQDNASYSRSRSRSRQRDKDRNRDKGHRTQTQTQRHRGKQKRNTNNRNARSSHRHPRDRRPKKHRQHSRSASSQSHSDRHKKKDKLKLDKQYHAFVELNNNNICNMPALESEKMEIEEEPLALPPPPPKICSAYLPQTASTAKPKKKNKQNKDSDNDDGHDSSDEISLDMATKISWTDTFRIFGCDDARIIMSAHDIIEVKTDWDDLDNNNNRQPSASASPSLCVSASTPSSKPAEPWPFTLCIDGDGGSGDILPMIQVSIDSTKLGKEYQCPQMVSYQRANCVSTDYCQYIMNNDMNESQCLFIEKVCMRVVDEYHERSKKELDSFRKQLENKPVFMSPRLFNKVHIVALKILSVEYSFSGATMNGVIVKILKPYSSNERNLFSFHKEQIPAAVPMGAAMTNTISSQSIQSTETTVTINHRN